MEQTILLMPNRTNNRTIAELTITILSQEWPLSLKTIQRKITKEYGKKASFQATHKALKKLLEKNVLTKQDLHYEINTEWLKQLNNFSLETMQAYLIKNEKNYAGI